MKASASSLSLSSVSPLMTEEILQDAVQQSHKTKTGKAASAISEYTVSCASGKGDGYMGVVYRILVRLEDGACISLIGKGMPSNVARRKTFNCELFFAQEVLFFNKVLTAFRTFEEKQRGKLSTEQDSLLALPACYYAASDGSNDFLLMEDLTPDGYVSLDRTAPLSVAQVTELIKLLARFHGVSLALKNICPEIFNDISKNVDETLFHPDHGLWTDRYVNNLSENFIKACEELKNTPYMKKLTEFSQPENFFKVMHSTLSNKENAVFNHGDTWITNFMFRGDEVKAIDFQLMRFNSPASDLSLVMCACTTEETRSALGGFSGMVGLYQREMQRAVELLGAPAEVSMSPEELQRDLRRFGGFGFGFSLELVQLSIMEAEDLDDLDRFDGEEALTLADITSFSEIKTEAGKQRVIDLVKFVVDEGMI